MIEVFERSSGCTADEKKGPAAGAADAPRQRVRPGMFVPLVAAVTLAAGCARDSAGPEGFAGDLRQDADAAFQTDGTDYELRRTDFGYAMEIAFEFTNPRSEPVYFANCRGGTGIALEKLIDGEWEAVWIPPQLLCLSRPIVVEPAGSWSGTIHVIAGEFGTNQYPQFKTPRLSGVYRLKWLELLSGYDDSRYPFGELLPESQRISNRFDVRLVD